MAKARPRILALVAMLILVTSAVTWADPVGTAFTYQGRLLDGGVPAEGDYDFEFTLYDDPTAGSVVAGPITKDDWPVTGGLFTAPLDFGSNVFTGDARWLKIGVRPWDSTEAYTYLTPRQELTPAPYSLRASNGVGGPEALNVDAADKVGIGTSTPNHKLEVTHATGGESPIFAEHTLAVDDTPAIDGRHVDSANAYGVGVRGEGGYKGVEGIVTRSGDFYGYGVTGEVGGTSTFPSYGVYGVAEAAGTNYGVLGGASGGTTNWAGYFNGDVHVTGDLSASGTKPFRIDHPLDPENKYLYHYALESPEVLNLYRGTVVLDAGGEGWAGLPTYFQSINRNFTYQLTAIGAPMPDLHVAQEIDGTRFKIAGGKAGMKCSWQVTGVRNDPYVREYGAPVEVEKPETERGLYQHPELYGQPEDRGIDYRHRVHAEERHPEAIRQPEEAATDSLEDVEDADLIRRLHVPEAREDGEDDERNAIGPAGLSGGGGAR